MSPKKKTSGHCYWCFEWYGLGHYSGAVATRLSRGRQLTQHQQIQRFESFIRPHSVDGDISKMDSAIKVTDAAIKHFNRIDLLVNNAGIYIRKPFTDYTPSDFELMIGTNVAGYFFITQRVVTQMRKQKSGHIVGISTVLVDQPLAGATITLPVLTKSTIPAFNRTLAMEYLADGIRVNTISPGVVDTPLHANDDHEILKKLQPIPRLVQISEIIDALLYLQSAPMVNGENIRIDGGAHAGAKW